MVNGAIVGCVQFVWFGREVEISFVSVYDWLVFDKHLYRQINPPKTTSTHLYSLNHEHFSIIPTEIPSIHNGISCPTVEGAKFHSQNKWKKIKSFKKIYKWKQISLLDFIKAKHSFIHVTWICCFMHCEIMQNVID